MTIDGWRVEQRGILDEFATYWADQSAKDPARFPTELDPDEWDRHFAVFYQRMDEPYRQLRAVHSHSR